MADLSEVDVVRTVRGPWLEAVRGRTLCMVIWDAQTEEACHELAAYRVWPSDDETIVDLLCPGHTARWRAGGFVRRVTSL